MSTIVIALGGNALLRRSEPMTAEVQRRNVVRAAQAIAPLAGEHRLVIAHGNGPQVGLLALLADSYPEVDPYPLDILGAETEGMIGYMIEQELGNVLPPEMPLATLLTMIEVDPKDTAFANPTKFVGPVYEQDEALKVSQSKHWTFSKDGDKWRRVVPSPQPQRIFEIRPVTWLLDKGAVVICAGGGGIPTMYDPNDPARLIGVEAVIDKDLASSLLAETIGADLLVMATDVDGVYLDWGKPSQRRLDWVTPDELLLHDFSAGSMGPKVGAAIRFATRTGNRAAIGALGDIANIVRGETGTNVTADAHVTQSVGSRGMKS
ncbi:MAG TPA: carbamate kinase [Candidatus Dormibacteraeota bacterium]|nr:carbamate kinase [Candidatus Dormibacteraeota bacterium]